MMISSQVHLNVDSSALVTTDMLEKATERGDEVLSLSSAIQTKVRSSESHSATHINGANSHQKRLRHIRV